MSAKAIEGPCEIGLIFKGVQCERKELLYVVVETGETLGKVCDTCIQLVDEQDVRPLRYGFVAWQSQ